MEEIIKFNITGLKCDYCKYINNEIKFHEYIDHINSKCPNCNNVLLTQEEYNKCIKILNVTKKINIILNILKWINPFYYISLLLPKEETKVIIKTKFPKRKIK